MMESYINDLRTSHPLQEKIWWDLNVFKHVLCQAVTSFCQAVVELTKKQLMVWETGVSELCRCDQVLSRKLEPVEWKYHALDVLNWMWKP